MKVPKLEKNKEKIVELLTLTGRQGIDTLVDWLMTTDFFTAPASTRLDFHGCEAGGLAQHALNVYEAFEMKASQYDLGLREDERTIASLCHDFCKIGLYVPNRLKSGALSEAKPYVVQDDFPLGHGEKSVLIVSRHIELTNNEALLMRWHMEHYDAEWENYKERVERACPAIHAFHAADMEASKYLDVKLRR
jgi:hypothetical protein